MSNSREALCSILDEALVTFEEFEDQLLNDPFEAPLVSSSVSAEDTTHIAPSVVGTVISSTPAQGDANNNAEKSTNKKRSWKKPKDKPKRPLSAYNLFFQFEREHMIAGGGERPSPEKIFAMINARDNRQQPKEKRRHRKTHGKVSFGNLARSISDKWKTLDKETRAVFEKEANLEKAKYKKELEEWNKKKNNEKETEETANPLPLEDTKPAPLPLGEGKSAMSSCVDKMISGATKMPQFMSYNHNHQSLHSMMLHNKPESSLQRPCYQDSSLDYDELTKQMFMEQPLPFSGCSVTQAPPRVVCGGNCHNGQQSYPTPLFGANHQQLHDLFPVKMSHHGTPDGMLPQLFPGMAYPKNNFANDEFDMSPIDFEPIEYRPIISGDDFQS